MQQAAGVPAHYFAAAQACGCLCGHFGNAKQLERLLFALTLTGIKTYPLTVGIAKYVGALSVDWGKCSAAATLTMLPVILVGFFMQKYLVSGMTAGAVKG